MDNSRELLQLILEYTNLSEQTDKLNSRETLSGYDNSELNCLDCVGRMDFPNVTAIAEEMRMTKGAVSKILRKLLDKNAVEAYQQKPNRQKVYYRLTAVGAALFAEHRDRHRRWEEREMVYFRSLPEGEQAAAIRFFSGYNENIRSRLNRDSEK